MGDLRDAHFVLPMLQSNNYEQRLVAVACLAFLQSSEHEDLIYKTAISDPDAGVRKTALWSYIFVKGSRSKELMDEVKGKETHKQVLNLLFQIEKVTPENIWFI